MSNPKYEPRVFLVPSFPDLACQTESPAEEAERDHILERVMNPTFIPIDQSAPLCRRFVPDTEDEEDALLLSACASSKTPEAMFPPRTGGGMSMRRYIHARDRGMLLLQTGGAYLDNGLSQNGLRAGAAFVFGPPNPSKAEEKGVCDIVLGPADATSNRAELIASIATLRARHWIGEGFNKIVVATDSEYVVNGCTEWCREWEARDWKTTRGRLVKNRDLWEELIWVIEFVRHWGSEVLFWQIPREWNTKADATAKEAAAMAEVTWR